MAKKQIITTRKKFCWTPCLLIRFSLSFDPEHGFEIYHVEIEPKTTYDGEPHKGNVEEYVFVTQGRLEITVEENHYSVNANQFIRFIANQPHTYYSAGEEMVSAIMMICYLG